MEEWPKESILNTPEIIAQAQSIYPKKRQNRSSSPSKFFAKKPKIYSPNSRTKPPKFYKKPPKNNKKSQNDSSKPKYKFNFKNDSYNAIDTKLQVGLKLEII